MPKNKISLFSGVMLALSSLIAPAGLLSRLGQLGLFDHPDPD